MLCSFLPALQSLNVWCCQASEQERALREFMCKLCSGVLSEPVSAPCGHHFCRPCLEKHFQVHCHKASGEECMLSNLCCNSSWCDPHDAPAWTARLQLKAWYSVYTAFGHCMYNNSSQTHFPFLVNVFSPGCRFSMLLMEQQQSQIYWCLAFRAACSMANKHRQIINCQQHHPLAQHMQQIPAGCCCTAQVHNKQSVAHVCRVKARC